MSSIKPESSLIIYQRPLPRRSNRNYQDTIIETHGTELFNRATHKTCTATISGKVVVFVDKNDLFDNTIVFDEDELCGPPIVYVPGELAKDEFGRLYEACICPENADMSKSKNSNKTEDEEEVPYIKKMSIFAETVIICSPLHLPQAEIIIYARKLIFKDLNPTRKASITTTPLISQKPLNNATVDQPGTNGDDGFKAGNVTL